MIVTTRVDRRPARNALGVLKAVGDTLKGIGLKAVSEKTHITQ